MLNGSVVNPSIGSGELIHSINLASLSTQQDTFGQPQNTWPVYYTCRASIRMLSGQELFQGDEFSSASQYRIVMRWPGWSVTVKTGDRVIFGNRAFVIQIVDNVLMRNRVLQLTCLAINEGS